MYQTLYSVGFGYKKCTPKTAKNSCIMAEGQNGVALCGKGFWLKCYTTHYAKNSSQLRQMLQPFTVKVYSDKFQQEKMRKLYKVIFVAS